MLLHYIYWLLHHYTIEGLPIEDSVLSLSQNKKIKIKIKMRVLYDINVRYLLLKVWLIVLGETLSCSVIVVI